MPRDADVSPHPSRTRLPVTMSDIVVSFIVPPPSCRVMSRRSREFAPSTDGAFINS